MGGAARIEFYRASERPYGPFSNLFRRDIEVHGRRFPTVEHAYQAMKPREERVREWLLAAPAPSLVAVSAHTMIAPDGDPAEIMQKTADALLGFHIRPGWSKLRFPWMLSCIEAKFEQHADLAELLEETGDALIVETGKIDDDAGRRWGEVNGKGSNYLGRMLMRTRAKRRGRQGSDLDLDGRVEAGMQALQIALESVRGWKWAERDDGEQSMGLPVASYDAGQGVTIESVTQRDGTILWAVRQNGAVLNKDGDWEWEPMPSSRDRAFFERCRYGSAQEALATLSREREHSARASRDAGGAEVSPH